MLRLLQKYIGPALASIVQSSEDGWQFQAGSTGEWNGIPVGMLEGNPLAQAPLDNLFIRVR
jgi:hypothetical protein